MSKEQKSLVIPYSFTVSGELTIEAKNSIAICRLTIATSGNTEELDGVAVTISIPFSRFDSPESLTIWIRDTARMFQKHVGVALGHAIIQHYRNCRKN